MTQEIHNMIKALLDLTNANFTYKSDVFGINRKACKLAILLQHLVITRSE